MELLDKKRILDTHTPLTDGRPGLILRKIAMRPVRPSTVERLRERTYKIHAEGRERLQMVKSKPEYEKEARSWVNKCEEAVADWELMANGRF